MATMEPVVMDDAAEGMRQHSIRDPRFPLGCYLLARASTDQTRQSCAERQVAVRRPTDVGIAKRAQVCRPFYRQATSQQSFVSQ